MTLTVHALDGVPEVRAGDDLTTLLREALAPPGSPSPTATSRW